MNLDMRIYVKPCCNLKQLQSGFNSKFKCSYEADSSRAKNNEMPVMVLLSV